MLFINLKIIFMPLEEWLTEVRLREEDLSFKV
jgi:hypothetical protein